MHEATASRRAFHGRRTGLHSINPFRKFLFGSPIATEHQEHTRLRKLIALPVFASDAVSSSAYATQEILLVLGAAGIFLTQPALYSLLPMWLTLSIVGLLCVVVTSYWQTIFAYPSGGGSYTVSKENLGVTPSLVTGAALLTDYVLTVAVSVAAGVQNLLDTPVMQALEHHQVLVCVVFIGLICLANLRGLRESGTLFSVFTYTFVGMAALMILGGLVGPAFGLKLHTEAVNRTLPEQAFQPMAQVSGLLLVGLVLKAFASGCAALTGTEAVSNGIPAFRRPEARNAAMTLGGMAVLLAGLFLGITALAVRLGVVYGHHGRYTSPAVIDQLSGAVFGRGTGLYYVMQFATAGILVLAANTAFADFPRLAAIISRDRFLPRQLRNQGDKLVFSNGIVLLAAFAIVLIAVFHGSVDRLIPLYAVGVFTAFTLSQSGMVRRWFRLRGPFWRMKAAINGFGALCTFVVLSIIAFEKFREGAWIVVIVVSILVAVFRGVHRHYEFVRRRLTIAEGAQRRAPMSNTVLLLVPSLHQGIFPALDYARSISPDCRAIHVDIDPTEVPRLIREWEANVGEDIPLVILPSPYRSFIGPLLAYLDQVRIERADHIVTVVLPELVPARWWHGLLHNANGPLVKLYLSHRKGVVMVNVRHFLDEDALPRQPDT